VRIVVFNPIKWVRNFFLRRRKKKREAEQKHACYVGAHDWRCSNEMHSAMSPLFEITNMPVFCPHCKAEAHGYWYPGKGLSEIVLVARESKDN
jgi:hypothetical protein